jgi:L-threonylcarbamoyladenylate synthase
MATLSQDPTVKRKLDCASEIRAVASKKSPVWCADPSGSDAEKTLIEAAKALQANEVVGFPTETVYGLAGNAFSSEAIAKIFAAKGRPSDNPLIVHVCSMAQFRALVTKVPALVEKIAAKFWPGPLTIVLPSNGKVSAKALGGVQTVGVRMPSHPVALKLIEMCGLPLAAPSANLSGKPSPTLASHVSHDLDGKIAGVVDGGATGIGLESTVLDCCALCSEEKEASIPPTLHILRPGGVTLEQLRDLVGDEANIELDAAVADVNFQPRAPGMKYTHYAPTARLCLVDGSDAFLLSLVRQSQAEGLKVGILTVEEKAEFFATETPDVEIITCGKVADIGSIAHELFASLRKFDATNVEMVFGHTFSEVGLGKAVMNRLSKAAGHTVIREPSSSASANET